jgi:hypothetical protein
MFLIVLSVSLSHLPSTVKEKYDQMMFLIKKMIRILKLVYFRKLSVFQSFIIYLLKIAKNLEELIFNKFIIIPFYFNFASSNGLCYYNTNIKSQSKK